MTCSIDEATEEFCGVISDNVRMPGLWNMDKLGGQLEEKIVDRIRVIKTKIRKQITFSKLTYKSFDVSETSGNLLVRQIIAIFSDKEIYKPGMVIVLTINNEPDAVIVVFKKGRPETFTAPKKCDERTPYWDKLFSDSMCEMWREQGLLNYEPTDIETKRKKFGEVFSHLWSTPFGKMDAVDRHVLYGLACEMAKPYMPHHWNHDDIKHIPNAACIKIAIQIGQTGCLERVIGSRQRPNKRAEPEAGQDLPNATNENISKHERRLREAKGLIKTYLGGSDEENFPCASVKAKVEEIRNFFALTE